MGWGYNFDLGKMKSSSLFLISSIKFWIDFYHLMGIRVDVVIFYLDTIMHPYPNKKTGAPREGCCFLQRLAVIKLAPTQIMIR